MRELSVTFKLLDKNTYRRMGLLEFWSPVDVVAILVSFDMQTNGLCELADASEHQSRLFNDYDGYFDGLIQSGKLKYDHNNNLVNKEELLGCLEANNILKLDIVRLKRFLSCDEAPDQLATKDSKTEISEVESPKHFYRFEKTQKGWDLQFEDVVLRDVKDLRGMKYIKILLEHPEEKISVFKLQEFAGTASSSTDNSDDDDSEANQHGECLDIPRDNVTFKAGVNAWQSSDQQAIQSYKISLGEIKEKLNSALACKIQNKSKIQRLESDMESLEKQIKEASYRPKDPQVELNRKRLLNSITYAITMIGKLEKICNHHDKPISRHLKRHIRTGVSCSYFIKKEDAPVWVL